MKNAYTMLFLPAIINMLIGGSLFYFLYAQSGNYETAGQEFGAYAALYIPVLLFLLFPLYQRSLLEKGISLKNLFSIDREKIWVDIGIAVSTGLALGLLTIGYINILMPAGFSVRSSSLWLEVVNFVGLVLIAPLIEEIIFRGYGKTIFSSGKIGLSKPLLVTSVAFALWHANWYVIPAAFIVGMVLYFIYAKRGTLLVPIIAHSVANLVFFLWF